MRVAGFPGSLDAGGREKYAGDMSDSYASASIACPQAILALVERFGQHLDSYKHLTYNETQVRREFIDPFFTALGWDVDNKAGHAEAYKDVIHEDAIKIGGSTKAPDYCFRIGGVRKFFVEAKKPSVGVKDDPGPAYQLRRYGWTNKLPLSIVTDFEEFAVYDCRIKPKPTDKPSTARVLYATYDTYRDKWGEIASIFSKDAILKGSFDKYAESTRRKRGTAEVDTEFLKEIESWREMLARNIALRNSGLSVRELNFAVAKTIDRIIFLRMCEDRGVETYEQLRVLPNGPNIYRRLVELFHRADERYNSGLFHFEYEKDRAEAPDELTPSLDIDDKVLKDIIRRLYYPECPYEFSVLPAEILGQVYEQFLGKVIRLTKGHRAVVEEKPEVKKAGGVYYTPSYIVDYIVKHTVGKLVEDAGTPKKVARLRVLDPACGSGSFLLGAYQYLLDWHLQWYTDNDPEKWAKKKAAPIYQSPIRDPQSPIPMWRLTVPERKRILLNNIYGVDIDPQAVEVTKLSLLLKVLEGESQQTLDNQLKLFHERALPDLAANIKCGNSLIGPDFYDDQQLSFLDEEERYRINAFDWHAEFPEVFKAGGFDAVIGNPPYGALLTDPERQYLRRHVGCFAAYEDSYVAFLESGLQLLKNDGILGMIIPSAIFGGPAYVKVREFLLDRTHWEHAILLPYDVFAAAYIDTAIVCLTRTARAVADHVALTYEYPKRERIASMQDISYKRVPQETWVADPERRIVADPMAAQLTAVLRTRCSRALGDIVEVRRGVLPGPGALSERRTTRHAYPYFEGGVYRYVLNERVERFAAFDNTMKERPKEFKWFSGPRILLRRLVNRRFRLMATAVARNFITNKNLYTLLPGSAPLELVLAVLNSRLTSYLYVKQVTQAVKDDFAQVTIKDLRSLPWPESVGETEQSRIVSLVQTMLDLHRQLAAAKTPTDKTAIQRQIDATDKRIDQLVYELYELTDDEIRIVEEATNA